MKIESAKPRFASRMLPEGCDIRGTIWPENRFALKLRGAWNNRFQMAGNGGTAGSIRIVAVDRALRLG